MRVYPKILFLSLGLFFSSVVTEATATSSPFINLDEWSAEERQSIFSKIRTPQVIIDANYQMTKDVTELLEKHGTSYWITFGTFMGAVRNRPLSTEESDQKEQAVGGPFQWDDDIDLGVKVESEAAILGLKEEFHALGYDVFRDPQEIVGLKVVAQKPIVLNAGTDAETNFHPFLDLFLYELEDGHYVLNRPEGKKLFERGWYDKNQIDHLEQYSFGPLTLWGPSDATPYFERMYGPAWNKTALYYMKHYEKITDKYCWTLDGKTRVPAMPSKMLEDRNSPGSKETASSASSISTHARDNGEYWNRVYGQSSSNALPTKPSSFAQFVVSHQFFHQERDVLELGCGNGRDSFFLAPSCSSLTAIDASEKAIESNVTLAEQKKGAVPQFKSLKIESLESLAPYQKASQVYARFFIHAIPYDIEKIVLDFFGRLNKDALLFLEYRTTKDPLFIKSEEIGPNEGIHGHYRRFIHHAEFLKALEAQGYEIKYDAESDEFSVLADDKPVLGRVIAQKVASN
ncbi:MAG: methyltransferase [Candidatus Nucleicultricaceae bacterium]